MYNLADWSTAPWWANWYAVDESGKAQWYELKPTTGLYRWWLAVGSGFAPAGTVDMRGVDWTQSLEARP